MEVVKLTYYNFSAIPVFHFIVIKYGTANVPNTTNAGMPERIHKLIFDYNYVNESGQNISLIGS